MKVFQRLSLAIKALRELGFRRLGLYACYMTGLRSGYLRWATPGSKRQGLGIRGKGAVLTGSQIKLEDKLLNLPGRDELNALLGPDEIRVLIAEAEEILEGKVRLFGNESVALQLEPLGPLSHWTDYERRGTNAGAEDIKFIWEAGRFGWAYTLARAYVLSGDERYPETFWSSVEKFLDANPPNLGPNWVSGQEAALRLMALAFSYQVFSVSPHTTPERRQHLAWAIAEHAGRIPPTLVYSRSLDNNHLLSEAAGMYTAAFMLPGHPSAPGWKLLGWRWFNAGLKSQIASDGAYTQNSTNYHRLMLQLGLWMQVLCIRLGQPMPEETLQKLAAAARWLLSLTDLQTGRVPNLGPNDGAYIFPLSTCPFQDYRPVLQMACLAFTGERPFPPGPWDEMASWLWIKGQGRGDMGEADQSARIPLSPVPMNLSPHVLHSPSGTSWAYLRVARFNARPGHADQLHLDLWWRGMNLAQDAGTYLYNAPAPWDNALSGTEVHNTLTINGKDQMTRAGRFLWLDRAQGWIDVHASEGGGTEHLIVAQHNGYRRMGLVHQRSVTYHSNRWKIEDTLFPDGSRLSTHSSPRIRLHWLLPDWPWKFEGNTSKAACGIHIKSPFGWILLHIEMACEDSLPDQMLNIQLVRAGELLHGSGTILPTWGWVSPTYGCKIPALSFSVSSEGYLPLVLLSEWEMPEAEAGVI